MWIALYVNCTHGKFEPVGPFDSEDAADEWIVEQAHDPRLWESMQVQDPTDPPRSAKAEL